MTDTTPGSSSSTFLGGLDMSWFDTDPSYNPPKLRNLTEKWKYPNIEDTMDTLGQYHHDKCHWQINSSKEWVQYSPIWSHPHTNLLVPNSTLKNAQVWHLMFYSECAFKVSTPPQKIAFIQTTQKLQDYDDDKIPYFDRGKQNCHCWWLLRVECWCVW